MPDTARGRCLCGGIRYAVTGELRDVTNCHCARCRRFTGHHMAATAAAHVDTRVEDPDALLSWFWPVPDAGYGFCSRCGSSLFWQSAGDPDRWSICAGTLEPPTGLTTVEAWWVSEASDYHRRPALPERETEQPLGSPTMSENTEVSWTVVPAAGLDAPTLYAVLVLRAEVFVVEQECAYLDPDGQDLVEGTRHLLGRLPHDGTDDHGTGDDLVAYARVLAPDATHAAPRIGRVIVAGRGRGRRLGRALMERALRVCAEDHPGLPVELGGQAHLEAFYASLGFEPGERYVEDGIPHVWMRRPAS